MGLQPVYLSAKIGEIRYRLDTFLLKDLGMTKSQIEIGDAANVEFKVYVVGKKKSVQGGNQDCK